MKQPIAGVAPPELGEVTVMTVWPSIAVLGLGRFLGRLYSIKAGFGYIFTVGNLIVLLSIPLALLLYFVRLAPGINRRYRLTNQRVIIEKGFRAIEERSVGLDQFDEITIEVLPGEEWFRAGEMVFHKGTLETFRISAVPRPESFRQVCLKAQRAYASVRRVQETQLAGV